MPSDDRTKYAPNCAQAEPVSLRQTSVFRTLNRLPAGVFNRTMPDGGIPGAVWEDVFFDESFFGVVPGDDPTPQHEIARVVSEEKDQVFYGIKIARSLQSGLGRMEKSSESSQIEGESPRASAADLDRVGRQFGIGRPMGFTDCCYWRLLWLVLFGGPPTIWKLVEIAELYTGERPTVIEEPNKVTLRWASGAWPMWFDHVSYLAEGGEYASYWNGDTSEPGTEGDGYGYWVSGAANNHEYFWGDDPWGSAGSLELAAALNLAKPAGVFIQLLNAPIGVVGCWGRTIERGEDLPAGGFVWAASE